MGLCSNRHGPEGCLGDVVLERELKFFRKQEGKLEMKNKQIKIKPHQKHQKPRKTTKTAEGKSGSIKTDYFLSTHVALGLP